MSSKTAVILAGGLGTRLQPFTVSLPKPLLPLDNLPILEIIIKQLRTHGFSRCVLAVNHQASLISEYFGNGDRFGIRIDYSLETKPLGTMGPLTLIEGLPSHFLVMNGDILTDLSYGEIFDESISSQSKFMIARTSTVEESSFGELEIDESGLLTGFSEKPKRSIQVSMGIYVLHRDLIDYIPNNVAYGFDNLVSHCLEQNVPVNTYLFNGYWRDLGTPKDYLSAQEEFISMRERFL